jgi:hypothetical protein
VYIKTKQGKKEKISNRGIEGRGRGGEASERREKRERREIFTRKVARAKCQVRPVSFFPTLSGAYYFF